MGLSQLKAPDRLIEQLKADEGFRASSYADPVSGGATIGYGHAITANDAYTDATVLTEEQATVVLYEDVEQAIAVAVEYLGAVVFDSLDPVRQHVVVEMAFQLGRRLLRFQLLQKAIVGGDWQEASAQILFADAARTRPSGLHQQTPKRAEHYAARLASGADAEPVVLTEERIAPDAEWVTALKALEARVAALEIRVEKVELPF